MRNPLQKHSLARFRKHVTTVVAGAPVYGQANTNPGVDERPDGGYA
jgi:hypothetical protein